MIDTDSILPAPRTGNDRQATKRVARSLARACIAAAAALAAAIGGMMPAFADNGETTGTFYNGPAGFEFAVPCDMGLEVAPPLAADEPAAKGACHLWDEVALTEPVEDRDLGYSADVNIANAALVLPGQVGEEDKIISRTTYAQTACGEANGTEFCIFSAWTAGTGTVKGKKVSVTRGGVGRLLILNDGCASNCASGGGPFIVGTDATAIANENVAIQLVYPEAAPVEWMFGMNNNVIGDTGAYAVTVDAGISTSPVANGAIIANATLGGTEELFSAIKTPGIYCTINGVCIRY